MRRSMNSIRLMSHYVMPLQKTSPWTALVHCSLKSSSGGTQKENGPSGGPVRTRNSRRARTEYLLQRRESTIDLRDDCGDFVRIDAFRSTRVHRGCNVVVSLPALHARVGVAHSAHRRSVHLRI